MNSDPKCVRCLFSDGFPKRLTDAPVETQVLTLECMMREGQTPVGQCLAYATPGGKALRISPWAWEAMEAGEECEAFVDTNLVGEHK